LSDERRRAARPQAEREGLREAQSSSGSLCAATAFAFAPERAVLEAAIAALAADDRSGSAVAADLRRDAFARYDDLPIPGARPAKNWRYDYAKLPFAGLTWSSGRLEIAKLPERAPAARVDDDVSPDNLATANAGGLIHVGSTVLEPRVQPNLDSRVTLLPLADAVRAHGDLVSDVLQRVVDWRTDRFAALATAFQNCGAFVYVPADVQLDEPIVLVFGEAPEPAAVFPHVVVILGENARATVLERHIGEGEPFVCGTVEARVGAGAQLDYGVVQQAGEGARVLMVRGAVCEPDATVRWHLAELGGGLARTVVESKLGSGGARSEIDALFFNTGMQHVDLATSVRHEVGHTTSTTVVRSAANDYGQGRYLGNIVILPHAHGSDATLRDDALLLSKHAHIDSIPALEIAANDVKAFHGATVGSIDEEQLFYAQSRGISRKDAERMIALAFFEPALARFPTEALRNEVRTALDQKINEATETTA